MRDGSGIAFDSSVGFILPNHVASVMLAEREWGGVDGVLYAYPHLTAEQVADALAFYLEHRDEIDRYIREQADDAEPEV